MIIRSVEFAGSVASPENPLPGNLPQVAFSGRSNVGKSSLINTLLGRTRKKIAKVSSTPGKTRTLNFFRVNERFFLVDLPGFGYAKAPGSAREAWKKLVEWYLSRPQAVCGVVHLVDGRHPPFPPDLEMMEYLGALGLPALVVLTKMDRVAKSKRTQALERASEDLKLDMDQILPFSSKTREGRDGLLTALDELLPPSRGD